MMYALLKKDFRTFRLPMLATLLLAAVTYLIGYIITFTPTRYDEPWSQRWLEAYISCSAVALVTTIVMAIAFAGTSIATERSDRTLDFLTMLPPRRWQVLVSKIAIAAPFLILCAIAHFAILLFGCFQARTHLSGWGNFGDEFQRVMFVSALWASGALMACGVAWMFSTFLRSSVICTGIAIAVLVAVGATVGVLADANAWTEDFAGLVWCVVSLSTGIATFAGGSFHFVRRVQP
jgi:ABC-type transport system involved in multi-copper enzyme maturation permease subunit